MIQKPELARPVNHIATAISDRVITTTSAVQIKNVAGLCGSCGRLVCSLCEPYLSACAHYRTPDFLARVYRDEPDNEKMIRGVQ